MTIQNISYGAVQTAYVSYNSYTLDTINTNLALVWPTPYATSTNVLAATTDLNCTATGCSVNFPNCNEVSLGMNVFIRNTGSVNVTVNNFVGTQIAVVPPAQVFWIQLTGYTDDGGGTWVSIQQGAGTTAADASVLAGYGLQAVATRLNTVTNVKTIADNYTVLATDQSTLLVYNTTGLINITLNNFPAGFSVSFNNPGAGTLTFILPEGVTINNQTNFSLSSNQTLTLISSGTNWWSLGLGQGTFFLDTVVSIDLTDIASGGTLALNNSVINDFVHQFYTTPTDAPTPITGDITIYYGNNPSNWYISNFCTTTNESTISIQLGTPALPVGDPILLPMQQKLIFYAATNPLTGILQLYSVPSVLNTVFADGTQDAPSITFENDTTVGIYRYNPGGGISNLTIVGQDTTIAQFSATDNDAPQILANPGDGSAPTYSFLGAATYGMGQQTDQLDLFASNAVAIASYAYVDNTATFNLIEPTSSIKFVITTSATETTLSFNAIEAISIDDTGIVTFPDQNEATLTALMPTSVMGAMIYFDGTNWVPLEPGIAGQVLTMSSDPTPIPEWV